MNDNEAIETIMDMLELFRRQRDLWQNHRHVEYETRKFNVAYYTRRIDALGVALVKLGTEPPAFSPAVSEGILVE